MIMSDKRVRYTFRLPNQLMKLLKVEAEESGISVNALILQILWQWERENNVA